MANFDYDLTSVKLCHMSMHQHSLCISIHMTTSKKLQPITMLHMACDGSAQSRSNELI